jgi:hypothetical protein
MLTITYCKAGRAGELMVIQMLAPTQSPCVHHLGVSCQTVVIPNVLRPLNGLYEDEEISWLYLERKHVVLVH